MYAAYFVKKKLIVLKVRKTEVAQYLVDTRLTKRWTHLLTKIRRYFWADKTKILNLLRKLDDSDIIEVTTKALGSVLPEHKKLTANLASSLEQDDSLNAQYTGEIRVCELQEIVVSNGVVGRNYSSANGRTTSSEYIPKDMQTMSTAIQLLDSMHLTLATGLQLNHDAELNKRRDKILQEALQHDDEDVMLAKRRETKAAARAVLKQRAPSATASARPARSDAQNASSAVSAAGDGLESPPPFDEEDAMLAKRRETKAAARAALKQRAPSTTDRVPVTVSEHC